MKMNCAHANEDTSTTTVNEFTGTNNWTFTCTL